MTVVPDIPSWWPFIDATRAASYFVVVSSAAVIYDCILTFGREVELVWRQRWSLMTVLYSSVRYVGIIYAVIGILIAVPTISVTDVGYRLMYVALSWMNMIITAILGVVMITRLHAMYQRSKKMLIFLVVIFLTVDIADGVIATIVTRHVSAEELILAGTYHCAVYFEGDALHLIPMYWILPAVWEVIALCLAVRIAVKHFRELQQQSAGGIIGDYFTVLMKTHVHYFASFVAVSSFNLVVLLSPTILVDQYSSLETQIFVACIQIFEIMQSFVLGPRLILGLREFNAKLVADSDTGTAMTSIVFQERVHVSTDSSV